MLEYTKTDEYWFERGGSGSYFSEGGELMKEHLEIMGRKKEERKDTLIVPYNETINANLGRLYIMNRTTTDTVKLFMSGTEFEVSLKDFESYFDLVSNAVKLAKPPKRKGIRAVEDGRFF